MDKRKVLWRYALPGILFLSLLTAAAWWGGRQVLKSINATPLRKVLPATAQDIHEQAWEEGGDTGQDYCYLVKAKIAPEEFLQLIGRLELTRYELERQNERVFPLRWSVACGFEGRLAWWMPSDDLSGTYVHTENGTWLYAKYENGYIYLVSYSI